MGGKVFYNGFSIGDKLPVASCKDVNNPATLVVRGTVELGSGRIYNGGITHGGIVKIDASITNDLTDPQCIVQKAPSINFETTFEKLKAISTYLASLPKTASVLKGASWDPIYVKLSGAKTEVLEISLELLSGNNQLGK